MVGCAKDPSPEQVPTQDMMTAPSTDGSADSGQRVDGSLSDATATDAHQMDRDASSLDFGGDAEDAGPTPDPADVMPADAGEQDPTRPSRPTACSQINQGDCECTDANGFTTWTWWVAEQQRCATTYRPPGANGPLPVLISNDCYSSNRLGQCQPGSEMINAADRFGFIGLCTTAADGNWTFGNDGVINDDQPTPCAEDDSKDITYLNGVFSIIDALAANGDVQSEKVYAWGFSQNAMFTAYTAFCYPERITAFWQGGSGLFVAGETNPLPQMEGVCRRSDYLVHGRACVTETPCADCQYFPILPTPTVPSQTGCIMAYADDFLFETAAPMAREMTAAGHLATLLQFPNIGRGHSNPLLHWDWLVGCMGVNESCSEACSNAVVQCMETLGGDSPQDRERQYQTCINSDLADCTARCAPTLDMLRWVERPCLVDGVCDHGETSRTCPMDCGGDPGGGVGEQLPSCDELGRRDACCGDMVCDGPENAENCVVDCDDGAVEQQLPSCDDLGRQDRCCGDRVCDGPENANNCVVDCR